MKENKVAFVSGASRGLGLEIARQIGAHGVSVILGVREEATGEDRVSKLRTEGIDAHYFKIEVTSATDIAALVTFVQSEFGRLDILVNNAGISPEKSSASTPELLRETFETNVIAPFALSQALLPLIQASPAGRIVNHSSILGSLTTLSGGGMGDWARPAYCSSKSALNMLTVILADSLKSTNVKVNAAHPGWVQTDLGGAEATLDVVTGAKTAVELALIGEDGPTGGFFHLGKSLPW